MTRPRPLSEMLLELLGASAAHDPGIDPAIRVSALALDLPVRIGLAAGASPTALEVLVDVPGWRWSTAFDQDPSRLRIRCEFGVPAS